MKRRLLPTITVLLVNACALFGILVAFGYLFDFHRLMFPVGECFHKYEFLKGTSTNTEGLMRSHSPHATRGWTPLPNQERRTAAFVTNERGLRSTKPYVYRPDAFVVLVAGDSFTFGTDAEDEADIWPTALERLDTRLQVVNVGVGGYGVDQMYVTIRETVGEYKPNVVMLAYIDEDLLRSMLGFFFYKKPRFELRGDELALANTPVGPPKEVLGELRRQYGILFPFFRLWMEERAYMAWFSSPRATEETWRLNARIVSEAASCARSHNAEFLLVHLAQGMGLEPNSRYSVPGEGFMDALEAKNPVPCLKTRDAFMKAGNQWTTGHYKGPEARFVAQLVWQRLQEMDSWKRFVQAMANPAP